MDIKDIIIGLSEPIKRLIDCFDRGISSLASPYVYKQMERAKMQIEQERFDQNAMLAIKDAMTQDLIGVARTSRDKLELRNVTEIYGNALLELQGFDPSILPEKLPSNEWAAHFYDCCKDCSDDDIRAIWSKILAGEIKKPGSYFKRTLTNLKLLEKHEAEWFVKLCKFSMEDAYVPLFIVEDEYLPYNEILSLVDCGFLDANDANMEIKDGAIQLKSQKLGIQLKDKSVPLPMHVLTFTDTGNQICRLVNVESDMSFVNVLIEKINSSNKANATLIQDS